MTDAFDHVSPSIDQSERMGTIRGVCKRARDLILRECPPSRERSLALTKLEEAGMWAVKSISHNQPQGEEE